MLEFTAFLLAAVQDLANLSLPSLLRCRSVEKNKVLNQDNKIEPLWKRYIRYDFSSLYCSKSVRYFSQYFLRKMTLDFFGEIFH